MGFRDEVFNIGNALKEKEEGKKLKNLIKEFNGKNSNYGYYARNMNIQFLGYLLINENIKSSGKNELHSLTNEEKKLFELGHSSIMFFIDACLDDIKKESVDVYKAINPYSEYKEVSIKNNKIFLTQEEIKKSVDCFKQCSSYRKLINSSIWETFKKTSFETLLNAVLFFRKELLTSPIGTISDDMKKFSIGMIQHVKDPQSIISEEIYYLLCLKQMLATASQLFFTGLSGNDLIILNNNNIIKIDSNANSFYTYRTALIQDILPFSSIQDVALIDCDINDDCHVHEFGAVYGKTEMISQEDGQTTKLTLLLLNEDLSPFNNKVE